ncbi:hypothetical protein ATANTOWER_030529 [Ataeniobius toweri]|uniref:Uncharacterized protein n=1 Tax=Ataeniobius toweri TaxID=208326 RepID=A0ABU7AJK6_9TELE|nr:hypothetical protein [Ataeniobius toweri]
MNQGMQLDQVKRKIPPFLFSWDTYSISREVMKCGMSCSLFEVVEGKGKATSGSLAALINKLERDRMVRHSSVIPGFYPRHSQNIIHIGAGVKMHESYRSTRKLCSKH